MLRFVSTYLPIIEYPGDLQTAPGKFQIDLEEARIPAGVNRLCFGSAVKRKPSEIREEMIDSYLKRQGMQVELRIVF